MEHDTDPLLTITAFAREAGAHVNSADKYEKLGELHPVRASDGTRLFRRAEVPKLRALVAAGRARAGRKGK
jgi:DNA-binding transcriptional MerR regulator